MYKDIWIKSQFLQDLMKIAVRLFLTKVGNNENIAPSLNIFLKKKAFPSHAQKLLLKVLLVNYQMFFHTTWIFLNT